MAGAEFDLRLPLESHVCAFMEDGDDPANLFAPFLRHGLDLGERVVAIAGPDSLQKHRRELEALHTNAARCEEVGRMQLLPWPHLKGPLQPEFDASGTLRALSGILDGASTGAPPVTRLLTEMDWVVALAGGRDAVAQYERGLDRLVHRKGKIAICVYDLSRLRGDLLIELLSAHPLTWTRGQLVASPFYARSG